MSDASPSAPFLRETWDRMAADYHHEEDPRFAPAVDHVVAHAGLRPGDAVLDLGTGTGSVAMKAAQAVGPRGSVLAVDISPEMLRVATSRAAALGTTNIAFREGSAEAIPAGDASVDAIASSLCLMFVPDRAAAARECARVLKPAAASRAPGQRARRRRHHRPRRTGRRRRPARSPTPEFLGQLPLRHRCDRRSANFGSRSDSGSPARRQCASAGSAPAEPGSAPPSVEMWLTRPPRVVRQGWCSSRDGGGSACSGPVSVIGG
jgi:SAM-dependent methyltransferase